uniref:Putative secreted protein n=1 Tax=Amblyomma triste TaxID=251400 RepID=A0A023G4I7_AMBTT
METCNVIATSALFLLVISVSSKRPPQFTCGPKCPRKSKDPVLRCQYVCRQNESTDNFPWSLLQRGYWENRTPCVLEKENNDTVAGLCCQGKCVENATDDCTPNKRCSNVTLLDLPSDIKNIPSTGN